MEKVSFGDFSVQEVSNLYTQGTNQLEFVWQKSPFSLQANESNHLKSPATLNATPDKYLLGGMSPNIPPNPPTTPVEGSEEDRRARLNINALPFVPGNVSIIVPPKTSPTSQNTASRKLYVGTCETKTADQNSNTEEQFGSTSDDLLANSMDVGSSEPKIMSGSINSLYISQPPSVLSTTGSTPPPTSTVDPRTPTLAERESDLFYTPTPTPPHTTPPHTTLPRTSTSDLTATQSTTGTTPTSVWGNQTKSWASIVGKQQPTPTPAGLSQSSKVNTGVPAPEVTEKVVNEQSQHKQLRELADQLSRWRLSHQTVSIAPRGLINQASWCYMHAPLQALLACPGFFNLFTTLTNSFPALSRDPSPHPIADTMIQFLQQFKPCPPKTTPQVPQPDPKAKKKKIVQKDFPHDDPFRPDCVYDMLHKIKSNLSFKGRQEDAEEFLGCLLDGLHEELVSALRARLTRVEPTPTHSEAVSSTSVSGAGDSSEGVGVGVESVEWEQVGPKNKSAITRQTSFSESPITEIFGGELRSSVHRQRAKESATLQPFFSLQLDIQSEEVWTVKDALEALSARETVHMLESEAHKRLTLARLPPVLVLHLKRFVFDKTGGSQKLSKQVLYSTDMELNKDLLSPSIRNKLSVSQRSYRLWAVVYHHGKTAAGGHYTADVLHPACGGWVRADDSILKVVPEEFVLKPASSHANKVAYILFYRRLDTIRT